MEHATPENTLDADGNTPAPDLNRRRSGGVSW